MPKRITICLAVAVTFSRSLEAPVVISPNTTSSAARPPSVMAIVSSSSWRVVRNRYSVGELEVVADDRVAHLVVGGDQALALTHHAGLLLRPGDHAEDALLELHL